MSLINQALRHAQMRRSAPHSGYESVGGLSYRPRKSWSMKVLIGFFATGMILVAGAGYSLRLASQLVDETDAPALAQGEEKEREADATSSAVASKAADPASSMPVADADDAIEAEEKAIDNLDLEKTFTPEQLTILKRLLAEERSEDSDSDSEARAAIRPGSQTASEMDDFDSPDPAVRNRSVAAFVANMDIQGVRAAGEKSRILIDGQVYRIGQKVDHDRGVRLQHVEPGLLIFVDSGGALYPRTL